MGYLPKLSELEMRKIRRRRSLRSQKQQLWHCFLPVKQQSALYFYQQHVGTKIDVEMNILKNLFLSMKPDKVQTSSIGASGL